MKSFVCLMFFLLLLPSAAHAQTAAQGSYNIADFIREDRFVNVKISPKGTYVAVTVPLAADDKTVLVIIKPGQSTPYGHVTLKEPNTHVADFWWVSNERLLFTIGERTGGLEQPVSFGEIWGTNADGTRQSIVAGVRAGTAASRSSSGKARAESASIQIVDTLIDNDDEVLVAVAPFAAGEIPFTSLERMDVYKGTRKPLARAPVRGASFLVDHAGQARFASGVDGDYKSVLYYRKDDRSEWQMINEEAKSGKAMAALGFSADNATAYLQSEESSGPDSIQAFDTATGTMQQAARDALVDPAALVRAVGKRYPIGVVFGGTARPRFEYFDPSSADAKLHAALQSSFAGSTVVAGSSTDDGRYALLTVYDDRNPGELFIFDTQANKADRFMGRAEWLESSRLAKATPVYFTSRDGIEIEGLLTTPPGSSDTQLPLVVHPHGGPFGVQDAWGFNRDVQMMAAHGYAVLQVNFRGSGGYGKAFRESGRKQWGLTMQDDLTDATLWAIREGVADKDRICIYGASYGGYASLMGVAKEPELYKCAVGYVGVYDLNMLWGRGDISQSSSGKDFLSEHVGKEGLDASSPNKLASRIQVPVFLAAGGADVRAPQAHSEAMARALKAAGKSVDTMYFSTEGHGFVKEDNQAAYFTKLLQFFERHIGGRAPVAPLAKKK